MFGKRKAKKIILLLTAALVALFLSACSLTQQGDYEDISESAPADGRPEQDIYMKTAFQKAVLEEEAAKNEDIVLIYYLNPNETELAPVDCSLRLDSVLSLPRENKLSRYLYEFMHAPAEMDVVTAPAEGIRFMGCSVMNRVVSVYFDENYDTMSSERKTLCNAALVKTICQIKGVDFVRVFSGDQAITDASGEAIGLMSRSDFFSEVSDINSYETFDIHMYFGSRTGTGLEEEERTIRYGGNTSLHRAAAEELINGPSVYDHASLIPPGTRVLGVSLVEGVCYLNLSEEFLNPIPGVSGYLTGYSVINTLCGLPGVDKVQIIVGSVSHSSLYGGFSLDDPHGFNDSFIRSGE